MNEEVKNKVGRPKGSYKYKTAEEFETKWAEYLVSISGKDTPRMRAFCVFAGITMETLDEYKNRQDFSEPIKRMLLTCEAALEQMLSDNSRKNIIGPIFALKNNFNWKDKQEIDTNINVNMADMIKKARSRVEETE